MVPHPVKLSICIPTYNRARFLERLLGLIADEYHFPFSYEVIVSDDCSPDDTADVVKRFAERGLPVHYFRCSKNLGYEKNLLSALHLARGELIIYLGDDDKLIDHGVVDAVAYMDANPGIGVCYTPSVTHDEVENKDLARSFELSHNVVFQKRDFDTTLKFILSRHLFPETAIYRASVLHSVWVSRSFCYWAFAYLAHFLDQSAVAFRSEPFYIAVVQSSIARDRPPAGEEEVMRAWDRYRGGLDYMLFYGQKRGSIATTPEVTRDFSEWIQEFTMIRMLVAARFWIASKNYLRAYELITRILSTGLLPNPELQHYINIVPRMAALQTLSHVTNSIAGVTDLIIHNLPNVEALASNLREMGLDDSIRIRSLDQIGDDEKFDNMVVLFQSDEDRPLLLTAGFHPGLLFSEADLVRTVAI